MQLVSKITLATFDFTMHLTIKLLSHIASCSIGKYFPLFSYFVVISRGVNISHIALGTVQQQLLIDNTIFKGELGNKI